MTIAHFVVLFLRRFQRLVQSVFVLLRDLRRFVMFRIRGLLREVRVARIVRRLWLTAEYIRILSATRNTRLTGRQD